MNLDKSFNDFVEVVKLSFKGLLFDNEAIEKAKKTMELKEIIVYFLILSLIFSPLSYYTLLEDFGVMGSFYYVLISLVLIVPFAFLISSVYSLLLKLITNSDIYTTFKAVLFCSCSTSILYTIIDFITAIASFGNVIIGIVLTGVMLVLSVAFSCRTLSIFYNVSPIKVFLIVLLYAFIFISLFFLIFFIGGILMGIFFPNSIGGLI